MGITIMGGSSPASHVFQSLFKDGKEESWIPSDTETRVYSVISLLSKEQRLDFWNLYEQGYIRVDQSKIGIKGDIWSYFTSNLDPEEFKGIYLQASKVREVTMGVNTIIG